MLPESDATNHHNPTNPPSPANDPTPVSVPSSAILRFPLLLKALGRRWLLATGLVLLLAALVGSAVFFFMPPPKHSVRTLIYAPPPRGIVFKQPGAHGDLSNHQRTQVAMLQSRLVLNSALRDPKVAKLSIVQQQIEPVEWLEKEVKADFAVAPEVLRISMSGDKPEQLVVLVDAIAQAYWREIVENEKNQRRERLNVLRELREKYEGQLRERQKIRREFEQNLGVPDAARRAMWLGFERQHLALAERELLQTRSKLREARLELELQQVRGKEPPELTIPDILVDEQINSSPAIAKLLAQAEKLKECLEKDRAALFNPELFPPFRANSQKLKKVQAELAEQREKLRPLIVQQLRDKIRMRAAGGGGLQGRIAGLEGIEKLLIPEVDRLRTVVQNLAKNGVRFNPLQNEIGNIENLVNRLVKAEQALTVELEGPTEFKVLEEAQILTPKTKSRMALMNAGVAVGGFALALLAVGWWNFSRRGRPAQLRAPRATPLAGQ
jgi:polysaccharide biosynthesis transport protein